MRARAPGQAGPARERQGGMGAVGCQHHNRDTRTDHSPPAAVGQCQLTGAWQTVRAHQTAAAARQTAAAASQTAAAVRQTAADKGSEVSVPGNEYMELPGL
jgi:hypothetical protein